MTFAANFNNEELMHLALHAAEHDTPEKTLSYLKQLLSQDPNNGTALYLMGAMHAEIGMYSTAIEEITKSLELEPNLPPTAAFQLGQLLITSGQVEQAESVWSQLDQYGEDDPYFIFKTAMIDLANDNFDKATEGLRKGIELNTINEPLNKDMLRLLENIENSDQQVGSDNNDNNGSQKLLLSIYEDQD